MGHIPRRTDSRWSQELSSGVHEPEDAVYVGRQQDRATNGDDGSAQICLANFKEAFIIQWWISRLMGSKKMV